MNSSVDFSDLLYTRNPVEAEVLATVLANVPGGTGEVLCGLEIEEWKH